MGMTRELESSIELQVVTWAETNGFLARKMQYVGRIGCPDRVFIGYRQTIWMEFKQPGELPRLTQVREHQRFEDRGVTVHVVDDVDAGIEILRFAKAHDVSPLTFG